MNSPIGAYSLSRLLWHYLLEFHWLYDDFGIFSPPCHIWLRRYLLVKAGHFLQGLNVLIVFSKAAVFPAFRHCKCKDCFLIRFLFPILVLLPILLFLCRKIFLRISRHIPPKIFLPARHDNMRLPMHVDPFCHKPEAKPPVIRLPDAFSIKRPSSHHTIYDCRVWELLGKLPPVRWFLPVTAETTVDYTLSCCIR